ncbi:erythrocyte membrane protein 1, partial [Plasmodium falciparum IGH-CR14]
YKAEKEKEKEEANGELVLDTSSEPDELDKKLKEGKIDDEFKRQMFYTLGDYRDICTGDEKVIKTLEASGDNNIETINKKIKTILNGDTSPGTHSPSSGTTPSSWWNNNAKHIWKGMVCALTYEDNGEKGTSNALQQNEEVRKAFFGDKTAGKPGTNTSTYQSTYKYDQVELKEDENSGGKKTNDTTSPTLKDFVLRPTYFRYLEEWGQNFCKKRTEMLDKIKEECRSENPGHQYCSGDGHDCTENGNLGHHKMLEDPNCPRCYEQCRKYKKWIDIKFDEYHKQEKKYKGEHDKLNGNSENKDYKKYYEEIENRSTVDKFLNELKHCKHSQDNSDPKINTDFEKPETTFGPLEYCKTCPLYGVNCNGRRGRNNQCTEVKKNGETWETLFNGIPENGENSTANITVEMIDRRGPFIKEYIKNSKPSEDLFKTSNLFKSVRDQNWECRYKDENTNVCYLKNFEEKIDLNKYTTFKVFLVYWLDDFLYGYYILKKRKVFEQCKENGEKACSEESKNDCACVKKWVDQKTTEWNQIKKHFNRRPHDNRNDIKSKVKMFLETLIPRMNLVNDKGKISDLNAFLKFYQCKCADNSKSDKEGEKKNIVKCLLDKLEKLGKKATSCPGKPSGDQTNCVQSSPLPDDEEPLEEEDQTPEDAKKMIPKICGDMGPTQQQPTEEGTCDPVTPTGNNEEKNIEVKEEEVSGSGEQGSPPAPAPVPVPPNKEETSPPSPPLSDQPTNSIGDILSSTIPFGIAIALTSIALLFLKKKTKSTIDLLRVINIPKSDYDIPTKLSPNRYIPYTSGKYRGKRYIYLEGDSGTDSGYTDHYSDITSSSESEYEELDINDIYAPRAPKYKTLIEVVLEPSGKLSGNTIPTSGNNTTASDTQNDIPTSDTPSSKITDNEWNTLKHDFISQYIQSEQPKDVPNDYSSGDIPLNTQPNTLYFDNNQEKPFIMSIHDRNLYTGEEYSYNINMSTNSMDDIPINRDNNPYSGIDLINDTLSGNKHIDIYDEVLKRKENELFGTNHVKQTSIHSVAKLTNSDPIHNQLELFHKWLDRHRDMCEKWENHHERLAKLKEEWENETHSGNTHTSDSNKTLNTDVSIQIDMNNPKTTNEFTYVDSNPNQVDDTYVDSNPDNSSMDTILEDLDKPFNEPYYYDMYDDDIYYDVNDDNDISTVDSNAVDVPSKVQIEMDVNTKLVKEKYPIADVWDI